MAAATMTSKGQVTIPAAIRKKLRLHPGSKIDFVENKAGETILKPRNGDIRRLRGFITHDGPPISIDEMKEAVGAAAVEDFERSVS